MQYELLKGMAATAIAVAALVGCGTMGDGIPPEQLGNYGIVVSRIGDYGSNMDNLPSSMQGRETTAYISWINGKSVFPAWENKNLLPGEYDIQVGINCGSSARCRPSRVYKIRVEAGKRYVLTPDTIYVSDRNVTRADAQERIYQ